MISSHSARTSKSLDQAIYAGEPSLVPTLIMLLLFPKSVLPRALFQGHSLPLHNMIHDDNVRRGFDSEYRGNFDMKEEGEGCVPKRRRKSGIKHTVRDNIEVVDRELGDEEATG